jgi:peptidoglycan/xylan/chitin deacetylase (PgdA/CDA1 family)
VRLTFARWKTTAALTAMAWAAFPRARGLWRAAVAAHAVVLMRGIVSPRSGFFCTAWCEKPASSGDIALTFDDGPDPRLTEAVLEMLAARSMRATFFVIARRAAQHPDIVKRAAQQGHVIGCHDLHHSPLSNLRLERAARREIGQARDIIAEIIGARPLLYRPPVGLMNPEIARALTYHSLACVGWSASGGDCGNRSARGVDRIDSLARPGAVVLLHDALGRASLRDRFLARLERLLDSIERQALAPRTIDAFFGIPAYATTC